MKEYTRKGIVDHISWGISRVAMFIIAFILVIMIFEVVMRYVFAAPTLWVNEMCLWVAGALYLSAGLYAMQQRSHIRIFLIYDMMPFWARKFCDCFSTAGLVVFAFATVWGGYGEAWRRFITWEKFGTAWDPPIPATIKPFILIMVVALAIQAVSNLITDWNVDERGEFGPEDDEVKAMKQAAGVGSGAAHRKKTKSKVKAKAKQ